MQDGSQLDIVRQFLKLNYETVLHQAKSLWDSPNATSEHHMRGTAIYNSRLLTSFISHEFTYK